MYRRDSPSRQRSVFAFVDQPDDTPADDAGEARTALLEDVRTQR